MQEMTTRQRELIRFALSFLMANRLDAFSSETDMVPTMEELDELYAEFVNPLPASIRGTIAGFGGEFGVVSFLNDPYDR